MDAALTPREIQSRIRAGESVAELAEASGMPESAIEPFAGAVLAERAYIANQAARGQVRREGSASHQTLAEMVGDRLASRGLSSADVSWDAWRGADRLWTLRASYQSGSAAHEGVFRYDSTGKFSIAVNDEARWLIGEASSSHGPQPGRRTPARDVDPEATVDLSRARRVRATLLDFEPDDYSPAQLTEIDGIYGLAPDNPAQADVLYDMLASFNEDSVRIYEGLTGPSTGLKGPSATSKSVTKATTSSTPTPAPQPAGEEGKEPTVRVSRKRRATVPPWDEIMFGSPQPTT